MALPLEDNFTDIVAKAQRGLRLSDSQLADRADVRLPELKSFLGGKFDTAIARRVAPALALDVEALVAIGLGRWQPRPVEVAGLIGFTTDFGDITVNAYLAWDKTTREAVAFDTGADCTRMLNHLRNNALTLRAILLTHTDGDHIFELDRLMEKTGAHAYVSRREPIEGAEPFDEGREFTAGALRIETRLTFGHSPGGITYVIHGLARPVAVVGDALFAGSMGGARVSYPDALATNRAQIFTLPADTILCPGHGPMTTVGEERAHNPFFAAKLG